MEACELEVEEWFQEVGLPLTFVEPRATVQMEATYHMFKYLNDIDQTNRLLNKICSILLP